MLIQPDVLELLADTLEGIVVPSADNSHEATILLFHGEDKALTQAKTPLIELNLFEKDDEAMVIVHSALGMVELREVEEIRICDATEEIAIFARAIAGSVSVCTVSSRGVLQVYLNIPRSVTEKELADLDEKDLRAAVALKVFTENARVFSAGVKSAR